MTVWTLVTGALTSVLLVQNVSAQPKDILTGRYMLIGCEEALASQFTFGAGLCTGTLEGLRFAGEVLEPKETRFCAPNEVTRIELVAAVVKWMKQHPKELEANFTSIAIIALSFTWPCKS